MSDEPVVVVGSGPCGAIAAAQLVSRGLDVVMLDAGLRAPSGLLVRAAGNTVVRRMGWSEYSTDRHDRSSQPHVDWVSSLSLGGLSNYWTGAVPRFAPKDFTDGARLDERFRWPITYDDLVPYYELAEGHLTVTAGEPILGVPSNVKRFNCRLSADWGEIIRSAARRGDGIGAVPLAKGKPWMVVRRGTEFDSYHCILMPMRRVPRFRLVRGAHVVRLNWSSVTGRVDSLDYVDRQSKRLERLAARAVVVAAGAIDSTALLLRSTSEDFPTGLGNTEGLVGRYLHDHPRDWWPATPHRRLGALAHPVYIARVAHADAEPLLATSLTLGLAARRDRLRTYARLPAPQFGVQVFGTMVPKPEVGVALGGAADANPLAHRPVISLRYDPRARQNLESARERLQDIFAGAGISLTLTGPFFEPRPGSSVHYGGTVRMHGDRTFGVLDAWNRIYDVPNVAVCDSSCFTTGPEKNPTLTAMAIAARAADRLADDLDGGRSRAVRIDRDVV
jgi:choline dehydrogenase-like flavoprotein